MADKEERDNFWAIVAFIAIILCGVSWFITIFMVASASHNAGELQMYKKLCPIEQLKGAEK